MVPTPAGPSPEKQIAMLQALVKALLLYSTTKEGDKFPEFKEGDPMPEVTVSLEDLKMVAKKYNLRYGSRLAGTVTATLEEPKLVTLG